MKYLPLVSCLLWAISCAPKYTASFQDYTNTRVHDYPVIASRQQDEVITDTTSSAVLPTEALTASNENEPVNFRHEAPIDLSPDTVGTVKPDTILLKNGDKIEGQITEVTSSRLMCRVSSWKNARSPHSKKGMKDTDQVILLKDVFLIKYANGKAESVNFTMKAGTTSSVKGDPKKNSSAIAGLVLSILSLFPLYGLILSIPAIILSLTGLKSERRIVATTGLVIGIIGLILGAVWLTYFLLWFSVI